MQRKKSPGTVSVTTVASDTDTRPGWLWRRWLCGFEQWSPLNATGWCLRHTIERDTTPRSGRVRWRVVSRDDYDDGRCPPTVTGPFRDVDAAFKSYRLLAAANGGMRKLT